MKIKIPIMANNYYVHGEPTDKIRKLIEYVDHLRKYYEKEEEYTICSELRDAIEMFGNYVLGYVLYEDIKMTLFDICDVEGIVTFVDVHNSTVSFHLNPTGQTFTFYDVKYNEMIRLENRMIEDKSQK